MTKKHEIKLFEKKRVRTVWDTETEEWYFSVVDIVGVLTDSPDPSKYWRVLKTRMKKEENESATCSALKMLAADGKMRLTDVATAEQLFRIIQSIPSPKSRPPKSPAPKTRRASTRTPTSPAAPASKSKPGPVAPPSPPTRPATTSSPTKAKKQKNNKQSEQFQRKAP